MTVDFTFRKAPKYRVISFSWRGPWQEKRIQTEFEKLGKWAKERKLKTGKWIFLGSEEKHEVAIEAKGKVKGDGRVRVKTLPASSVASITFDPDAVSPRVVYHGVTDWLRWRKKEKEIKSVLRYREVYTGNPWRDARAWSKTTVEVVVRR